MERLLVATPGLYSLPSDLIPLVQIVTVRHQLVTRGTEVRFQWVPSHVCLSGNEMADRAAKKGAGDIRGFRTA